MPSRTGQVRANEIGAAIGRDVRVARSIVGLTREQAAELAGIAPSTFALIEAGNASVRLNTLSVACAAVGLNLSVKGFPAREPSLRDATTPWREDGTDIRAMPLGAARYPTD